MSRAMTAPTKHPKSGVYRIRTTVPLNLRGTTDRLFGVKREFTETFEGVMYFPGLGLNGSGCAPLRIASRIRLT